MLKTLLLKPSTEYYIFRANTIYYLLVTIYSYIYYLLVIF